MRSRALVAAALLATVAPARAVERVEQGPVGVATAGAQTADADSPAAVYYDPAALAFQRGFSVAAGVDVSLRRATASTASGDAADATTLAAPAVFAAQRISSRYAVGIGVYEPFAWSSAYAAGWPGRYEGLSLELHAIDVNPVVAIRPLRWLAIAFGVDILPTTFSWQRATMAPGGGDGTPLSIASSATGAGGNASLFVRILPRWLDAAFSYRSAAVVELPYNGAHATLTLPHTFTWGAATHPVAGLTITADVRFVLWQDLRALTFATPDGGSVALALAWQNTVGVRAGAQYRFWRDRLVVRVGGGWEQGPSSAATAPPVLVVGDRGLIGGGIGGRWRWLGLDAGYLATIGADFTGASNSFVARYSAVTHTISVAASFRLDWPRSAGSPTTVDGY